MARNINRTSALFSVLLLIIHTVGCSQGEPRGLESEKLLVDVISRFGCGEVLDNGFAVKYRELSAYKKWYRDPWGVDSPRLVKVGFDIDHRKKFQNVRRSLYLGAYRGSPVEVRIPLGLSVPRNSRMVFSLGGYMLRGRKEGNLSIVLRQGNRSFQVFQQQSTEAVVPEQGWRDYVIQLPTVGSSAAVLEFRFETDSLRTEHLFIANPRIYTATAKPSSPPNVIFVIIDATRADAVNATVEKYRLTPNIDALARDGMNFRRHFVVSNWTRPSTIAALCSVHASRSGVNFFYPPVSDEEKRWFYRESGIKPVTTLLKEQGYITRSIGNNAFIIDYTGIGTDLDFDELSEYQTQWEDTVDITDEVISWLGENSSRNFFLFINYNAPHNAYIPPKRYLDPLRQRLKDIHPWFRAYLGEISYTDDHFGRVIHALKKLGLYDNTIVVVTSDHGEVFNPLHEQSVYTGKRARFSHGQTLFDEEMHTPLIIKPQGDRRIADVRCDSQVRSIDVTPTLLELMGMEIPAYCQGISLLPLVKGVEKEERVVYCEGRMMYGVRARGYKYNEKYYGFGTRPVFWGGDIVHEYRELYDLTADPHETMNLIGKKHEAAARMSALLHQVRFTQPVNVITSRSTEVRGMIRVIDGFFHGVAAGNNAVITRITRKEYHFSLTPGGCITFSTVPADARIKLTVEKGASLLAGPHLLPLIPPAGGGVYILDTGLPVIKGKPQDELIELVDRGLLFWNSASTRGIRGVSGETYLSRDINRLLQKWGYIQGKEKKE